MAEGARTHQLFLQQLVWRPGGCIACILTPRCACVQATASDSPFWMLMALPALFLAWYVAPLASLHAIFLRLLHLQKAFACSILAVLYLSFSATCSGPCQGDACGAAIGKPLLLSRVFFVLVVGASLGLVCFAMKTVRRPAAQ